MEKVEGRPAGGRLAKRCLKVPGNTRSCTLIAHRREKVEQHSRRWEVCRYQRARGLRPFVTARLAKQRLIEVEFCRTTRALAVHHRRVLSALLRMIVRAHIGSRNELREKQH